MAQHLRILTLLQKAWDLFPAPRWQLTTRYELQLLRIQHPLLASLSTAGLCTDKHASTCIQKKVIRKAPACPPEQSLYLCSSWMTVSHSSYLTQEVAGLPWCRCQRTTCGNRFSLSTMGGREFTSSSQVWLGVIFINAQGWHPVWLTN